ncbi:MAG TPA: glycogen/starch synthase [Myxococcota bacterium]|nr:glycogen/starch synthase [Myxococcota bacterium]HRY92637.1 glycogen/starch synthase [Myxococcota bacterium]HSA23904.1 glycogen/starch synthase [Myxococcota bacterium]
MAAKRKPVPPSEPARKLRVAMPAWEIGRAQSGLGAKIGGLGVIVEELPAELVRAAAAQGLELEVEVLSPCFAHFDRRRLTRRPETYTVSLDGHPFEFEAYEHVFPDGVKVVYFWDAFQLGWTSAEAIYPHDPQVGLRMHASVCQAMAGYIRARGFDTVHLHDYHVGLIPFYLGDELLQDLPVHFTIHNATYQGITPTIGGGFASLDRLGLPGQALYHKYFDYFDHLNLMKACLLKVHEQGGKITTVSGDVRGSWGYAAELRQSHQQVWSRAYAQKGSPPGEVFVPNRHLDLFEKLPVAGITNGLGAQNRPERMPELTPGHLTALRARRGRPIFSNPAVEAAMLSADHRFDAGRLEVKAELKRLLHLEAFGSEPLHDPILMTVVGRLAAQKNLGLVAEVAERLLAHDGGVKLLVLASAPEGEKASEAPFFDLARRHPGRVWFHNAFNLPLSKLVLAGGDFSLIPSRFEPCGLVDYEAALLGNLPIARATGGLTKVRAFGYLYEWEDVADRAGEAAAFLAVLSKAIDTYRREPAWHQARVRAAMGVEASWDASAGQYVRMYRYGLANKRWQAARRELLRGFVRGLGPERALFTEFFQPGREEYGDHYDWDLWWALAQAGPDGYT